ncbi:amino acid ABC transporter substrate-binding protein [Halobellus rarus]|uniref:Amino acid ABC transporter substrate-binding protein n=1 Tax=Halobellus rarus TaxID=1126237 RepID=A0ABD6CRG3_9EURY
MSRKTITRRGYLAGSTVALAGLSGCSLPGSSSSSSDTITIGSTIPETGQFSSLGQDLRRGYELGVQRIEENNDDLEVELILQDDESDPEVLRQQLQQITSNNDVDMLWGSFSSLLVPAGSAFAEQEEIPFVAIAASYEQNRIEADADWTFIPFPHSRDVVRGTLNTLEQAPESATDVAIWEPNSGWGEEMAATWEEQLSNAGYEIVLRERYSIGSSDFSSIISQTAESDPDILLSNPTPNGGITAMQQMEAASYIPDFIQFVRAADPFAWWSALGESGRSVCMCPGWVPGMTGNGNEALYETYQSEYGEESEYPPVMVGASYNLTQVAEQALVNADSISPDAIQEQLQTRTFETVTGEFGFDDVGRPKEGELSVPTGQWSEGQQRLVSPQTEHPASMDLKYPIDSWDER